jgi:hypothetical protein
MILTPSLSAYTILKQEVAIQDTSNCFFGQSVEDGVEHIVSPADFEHTHYLQNVLNASKHLSNDRVLDWSC